MASCQEELVFSANSCDVAKNSKPVSYPAPDKAKLFKNFLCSYISVCGDLTNSLLFSSVNSVKNVDYF